MVFFRKSFLYGKTVEKSVKGYAPKLEYFKKLVMQQLDELEEKENAEKSEVKKSILEAESMQKSGYPVGTIREWKGKKYIKIAPGKWRPKYDGNSRGAKMSIAALKRKADKCTSSEELLQLILENRDRFSGQNGRPLPFVKKLSDYISQRNDAIESANKPAKRTKTKKKEKSVKNTFRFMSKVKDWIVNLAKETGLDIAGFKHKTTEDFEHHAIKKHGNEKTETGRGQVAVTQEDLDNIQDVMDNPDIAVAGVKKYGEDRIVLVKNNGHGSILVEEVLSGKKNKALNAKTFWILDKTVDESKIKKILENTKGYDVSKIKTATPSAATSELSSSRTDEDGRNSTGKGNGLEGDSKESPDNSTIPQNGEKSTEKTIKDIRDKYEASKSVTGNKKTVTLPNGNKIKCHYKIVEADAPTASHDERTYAPTEGFPKNENGQNINDRDYQNDVDAQESVRRIAANFNSLALESPPIVTKDGIVISGNNRTMSSKLAARNGTDKAYLNDLREMIDEYGLEESDLEGFKNPRLVLEVDQEHEGDYTTEEFAQFNRDTKKTMSNVEKAVKLTKTLNEQKISSIASELSNYDTMSDMYNDPKGSQAFVSKLIEAGIIGDNEKAQYCKSDGTLNDTGKDFVETVLVGSVLNEGNIRKLDGAGGKRIRQKLVRAILPLIENKGNGKEYSFNAELNTAVDIAVTVAKDHDTFKTVADYLAQGSLFGDKRPDEVTGKLAKIIHDDGEKAFAQRMKDLGAGLQESASGVCDIFLGGVESKQSLMERFLDIKKSIADILTNFVRKERTTRELVADVLSDIV